MLTRYVICVLVARQLLHSTIDAELRWLVSAGIRLQKVGIRHEVRRCCTACVDFGSTR